jgi:hypothetical protein
MARISTTTDKQGYELACKCSPLVPSNPSRACLMVAAKQLRGDSPCTQSKQQGPRQKRHSARTRSARPIPKAAATLAWPAARQRMLAPPQQILTQKIAPGDAAGIMHQS